MDPTTADEMTPEECGQGRPFDVTHLLFPEDKKAYRWGEFKFWSLYLWDWIHHPIQMHGPAILCRSCWGLWWKVQNGEYLLVPHHASRVPGLKRRIPKLVRLG